jgi:hypothetical protein
MNILKRAPIVAVLLIAGGAVLAQNSTPAELRVFGAMTTVDD